MKWLVKDKLCSFAKDTVRIELGPQIIELNCNKKNLSNAVTAPHYQVGKIDAYGNRIILGKKMCCVDWRAIHVPHLWKVYQMKETGELDKATGKIAVDKDGKPIQRFIKVNEYKYKDKAIAYAKGLI